VTALLRPLRHALVLIGYLLLAMLAFRSVWRAPATTIIGAGGDPQISIWFIHWVPFAVTHGFNPLLTDWLDYPGGVNLMWNTSAPLVSVLLWPVTQALGANFAYNLAETLALATAAWAAYWAFGRYVRRFWARVTGGLLFGFSPYMFSHALGHPALIVVFTVPLMFLLFDDILVRQQRPAWQSGLLLGLAAAAQLLISEQVLAAEGLLLIAAIAVLLTVFEGRFAAKRPYAMRAFAVALGVFLPLVALPLSIQLFGPAAVYGRAWSLNSYVSDLLSFIVPTRLQAIAPQPAYELADHFSANIFEWSAYLGLPLLALIAFAGWRYRSEPLVRVLMLLIGFAALLSMGTLLEIAGRATPIPVAAVAFLLLLGLRRWIRTRWLLWTYVALWAAMAFVPLANDLLPGRLTVFVFLFVGLLVAVLLDQAQGLRHAEVASFEPTLLARRQRVAVFGLAALAAVFLLPFEPFPSVNQAPPAFLSAPAVSQIAPGSVVLVAPFAYDWRLAEPMRWQLESGMRFRLPEGFVWVPGPSAYPPGSALGDAMSAITTGSRLPALSMANRSAFLADLRRWRVRTVLVGPMGRQDQMVDFFTTLLGRPPVLEKGAAFWLDVS